MKSKRQVDTKREKIVTEALIGMLKDNISDIDVKINDDKKLQLRGVDLKIKSESIFGDGTYHAVDCKAATDYIVEVGEKGLPTFAMELGSTQKEEFRIGWAISDSDEFYSDTEYYVFQWIFLHQGSFPLCSPEDIAKIEVKVVSKKDLKEFIESVSEKIEPKAELRNPINLTYENIEKLYNFFSKFSKIYSEISKENRDIKKTITIEKKVFSINIDKKKRLKMSPVDYKNCDKKGPKLVFTPKTVKEEQPLNLVIPKYYLDSISIYKRELTKGKG